LNERRWSADRDTDVHAALKEELERTRLEVYEWRRRALDAESANVEWEAWRNRRGWRIYMQLLALRERMAPAGTLRDRVTRAVILRLPRRGETVEGGSLPQADVAKAVLWLSGLSGDSARYRCHHLGEAFGISGGTFDVGHPWDVDLESALDRYECFVLHRMPWSGDIERFIADARARGKAVIYDTDDLVFDPDIVPPHAEDQMTERDKRTLSETLLRIRRTLTECDAALVSTDALAVRTRVVNDRVSVAYNVVTIRMVEQADAVLQQRQVSQDHDSVTLAYLSGTPTHNRDFAEAAEALLWALETFPQVRFVTVGHVSLDPRFEEFGPRVLCLPRTPRRSLPELLAGIDVNLAPLERDNPFTESKSCIKYLEAGLLGVPTIASPRSDFVRAIDHGVNGFLAEGPEEWRRSIHRLVESSELRRTMGRAARSDVQRNHTTGTSSSSFFDTLAKLVSNPMSRPLVINVVDDAGSADNATVIAGHLSDRGHRVAVSDRALDAADVSIALSPSTASIVAAHTQSLFKCLYIDKFPSDLSVCALPLRPICSSAELAEQLIESTGRPADAIDASLGLERAAEQLGQQLERMCFVSLSQNPP
jgi:glycosyltransferase involved in cell wall biosynthesis